MSLTGDVNIPVRDPAIPPISMSQKVGELINERRVTNVQICGNGALALAGIALVAFSVAMFILLYQNYGWHVKMAPLYAFLGVTTITGTILSIAAINKMIESCRRRGEFRADARQIT
jgi:hypothetical protein